MLASTFTTVVILTSSCMSVSAMPMDQPTEQPINWPSTAGTSQAGSSKTWKLMEIEWQAPSKLFASRTHTNALKPRISPAPQTASGGLATFEYCFNHFLGNYGDVQIDTTDPQVAVDTCAARAVAERSTTFILNNYAGSFTCTFGNTATSKSEECTSSDYALYTVNAG